MDLRNKIAIITGGSKGIGRAISEALVEKGATVYGLARSLDALNALQTDLGRLFQPVSCDVRVPEAVEVAIERVQKENGRVDILINNAGLGRFAPVAELSLEDWKIQIDTNITGTFLCTRAVAPLMKQQNEREGFGGHIVNIASIAGLLGNPELSGYNASKFAVRGFSDAMMKELRQDGIKVTCVYPGSVDTHFFSGGSMERSRKALRAQDVADTIVHILEMPDNYLISEIVMRPLRPN